MKYLLVSFVVAGLTMTGCGTKGKAPGEPKAMESRPDAPAVSEPSVLETVTLSPFGSEGVTSALEEVLNEAVGRFTGRELSFEIEGHTDSSGSEEVNERVGLKRATMVSDFLQQKHSVPAERISVTSYGETQPAYPNDTPENRAKNRRVVVRIIG